MDDHPAKIEILVEIDHIVAHQFETQLLRMQRHLGDQGLGKIVKGSLPPIPVDPSEPSLGPYAETKGMSHGMILLANMRPIQIAKLIVLVKIDQQGAIAHGNVSGHVHTSE
jgi:hypothetical protein